MVGQPAGAWACEGRRLCYGFAIRNISRFVGIENTQVRAVMTVLTFVYSRRYSSAVTRRVDALCRCVLATRTLTNHGAPWRLYKAGNGRPRD